MNDSPAHAEALARLLGGQNCHVNLIPVNPVAERGTKRPDKGAVQRFAARLGALGLNATVRRELGSGKAAAATVLIQCVIAWVMAFLVRCVGLALGFA